MKEVKSKRVIEDNSKYDLARFRRGAEYISPDGDTVKYSKMHNGALLFKDWKGSIVRVSKEDSVNYTAKL